MKYAPDRDEPIPAIVIATVIVAASRATGADPIAVASGELDQVRGMAKAVPAIARARSYAGFALRYLYPSRNRTMLASYVGAKANTSSAFFSALDQRINGGLSWWRPGMIEAIVSAGQDAIAALPRHPAPPLPPQPLKMGPLPAPKFITPGFTDRDRERRACNDILADAAANTARLQKNLPKEPED